LHLHATKQKTSDRLIVPQEWDPQGGPVAEPLRKLATHRELVAGSDKVINMDRSSIHNSAASHPTTPDWPLRTDGGALLGWYRAVVRYITKVFALPQEDRRVGAST